MKRSDIAMIILIASVSAVVAYFIAQAIFGNFQEQGVKVQTVDAINATIEEPDPLIFNSNAINPTVEVQISSGAKNSTDTSKETTQ